MGKPENNKKSYQYSPTLHARITILKKLSCILKILEKDFLNFLIYNETNQKHLKAHVVVPRENQTNNLRNKTFINMKSSKYLKISWKKPIDLSIYISTYKHYIYYILYIFYYILLCIYVLYNVTLNIIWIIY